MKSSSQFRHLTFQRARAALLNTAIALTVVLTTSPPLLGQNNVDPVSVRLLAWQQIQEPLYLALEKERLLINLSVNTISEPFEIESPKVRLDRLQQIDGDEKFVPFASTPLPKGAARVIGLVVENSSTGAEIYFLSDDLDQFPLETVRMVNLTGSAIAMRAGENVRILQPRETALAPLRPDQNHLRLDLATDRDGQWKYFLGRNLPTRKGIRVLGIIRPTVHTANHGSFNYPSLVLVMDTIVPPPPLPVHPSIEDPEGLSAAGAVPDQ
ncbi:MAG: hypothetical protein ACFCU4_09345 [Puniceicoccaceae bacterium]